MGFDNSCSFLIFYLITLPFPILNNLSIDRSVIHVAQFLQYELCWIKDVLDRLTAEQFVYSFDKYRRIDKGVDSTPLGTELPLWCVWINTMLNISTFWNFRKISVNGKLGNCSLKYIKDPSDSVRTHQIRWPRIPFKVLSNP